MDKRLSDIDHILMRNAVAEKLEGERVVAYLDSILDRLRVTRDVREYRLLLAIFRKWKIWLMNQNGYFYKKTVPFSIHQFSTGIPSFQYSVPSPAEPQFLKELTAGVIPVGSFHEGIQKIEGDFLAKDSLYQDLRNANLDFSEGRLPQAHQKLIGVIDRSFNQNAVDELQLYFLSWALHSLGNLFIVQNRTEKGFDCFNASCQIKAVLQDLPHLNYLATSAKQNYTHWLVGPTRPKFVALTRFYRSLCQHTNLQKENRLWYLNLKGDALCNIGIAKLQNKQNEDAKKLLTQAIEISQSASDRIGMLRSYFVLSGIEPTKGLYNRISELTDTLSHEEKLHPYAGTLNAWIPSRLLGAMRSHCASFVSILRSSGVKILDEDHLNYNQKALNRNVQFMLTKRKRRLLNIALKI